MSSKKTKLIAASLLISNVASYCSGALIMPADAAPVQKAKARPQAPRIIGPKTLNTPGVQHYLARLRGRISNNWMLADGKNVVVISVSVSPDGAISDLSTANSKADSLAIQSATVAFEKAQPLEPLPAEANATCKLQITFTSNVDPHGDSNSNVSTKIDVIPQAPATAGSPAAPGNSAAAGNPAESGNSGAPGNSTTPGNSENPTNPSTQTPAQN